MGIHSRLILNGEDFLKPELRLQESIFGYQRVQPEWAFRERVLDDHLLYFITSGLARAKIEGQVLSLEPGSVLWLSPDNLHDFWLPNPENPIQVYHFRAKISLGEKPSCLDEPFFYRLSAWELQDFFRHLYNETSVRGAASTMRIQYLWGLIFSHLTAGDKQQSEEPGLNFSQRELILREIELCQADWPSPADLAASLNLSADYFSRLFKRSYGCSARSWLKTQKIRRAAMELSNSSVRISDLAERYGYRNIYFFSRQFKEVMGQSPRHWRKKQ